MPKTSRAIAPANDGRDLWLLALRRYLGATASGHFAWEILQLPLYTIWDEGKAGEIAFAVAHCTGGDVLIALSSLTAALIVLGNPGWPSVRFREVAAMTLLVGLTYTFYSEWFNVSVRGTWAYSTAMPTIPLLGTGLTPTLQWVVVPLVALVAARSAVGQISDPS